MAGLDPRPLGRSGSPQPLAARRLDGRGWLAFASPQTSGQPRVDPQHLVASALRLFGATILPPALRKPPFSSGSLSGSSHTLMNSKRKTLGRRKPQEAAGRTAQPTPKEKEPATGRIPSPPSRDHPLPPAIHPFPPGRDGVPPSGLRLNINKDFMAKEFTDQLGEAEFIVLEGGPAPS